MTRYFQRDIPEISFECIKLFKRLIEPTIQEVKRDKDKKLRLQDKNFVEILRGRSLAIMDALVNESKIKADSEFGAPLVVSYLANTALPLKYTPSDFYSVFEFSRLEFNSSALLLPETPPIVSEMLIGGFTLVRLLVYELMLNNTKHYPEVVRDPDFDKYLRAIGIIIYYGYIDTYGEVEAIPGNTGTISREVPVPYPLPNPLCYSKV